MASIAIFNGLPEAGGVDGTLVTSLNPINGGTLDTGGDAEGGAVRHAVRVLTPGYQHAGDFVLELLGAHADKWALAPDAGGSPGTWEAWGDPLTLAGPILATNRLFWIKARVTDDEPQVLELTPDVSVSIRMPDTVTEGAPVGRSWAFPYGVADKVAVGRSWALPFLTSGVVGRSFALPYGIGGAVGRSWALPSAVKAVVGKSWALPYTIEPPPLSREAAGTSILCYFFNEGSGTNVDDKASGNHDMTLVPGGSGGAWLPSASPWGDACFDGVRSWGATGSGWSTPGKQAAGTLEFIVKFDTVTPNGATMQMFYLDKDDGTGVAWMFAGLDGDEMRLDSLQTGSVWNTLITSGADVTPNVWHHLAWTWTSARMRAYLNGVLVGSNALDGKHDGSNPHRVDLVGRGDFLDQSLDGKLAYFRAWAVEKTAAELLASKQAMLG